MSKIWKSLFPVIFLLMSPAVQAQPVTDIDLDNDFHNRCFLYSGSLDRCRQSPPPASRNSPNEYTEITNCSCENGAAKITACQVQQTIHALEQNMDTLEWRYRAASIEEDLIGDPSLCTLCSPEIALPDCSVIRSDSSGEGPTISDCRAGKVFEQSQAGILKQCFEVPVNSEYPEYGTYCTSLKIVYQEGLGAIRYQHSQNQCCGDRDLRGDGGRGDGAGDGACGEGNPHGNGHQDCDPEDEGVQRGCNLETDVVIDFSEKYKQRVKDNRLDEDLFFERTFIGIAENCQVDGDANGDGYDSLDSYQCNPLLDPNHHDVKNEYPYNGVQIAVDGSEVVCKASAILDSRVEANDQKIRVRLEERVSGTDRWEKLEEKTINANCSREEDDPESKCALTSIVGTRSRGRQLRCSSVGYVDQVSDYFMKKEKTDVSMSVVRKMWVILESHANINGPFVATLQELVAEDLGVALSSSFSIPLNRSLPFTGSNERLVSESRSQMDSYGDYRHPRWLPKIIGFTPTHTEHGGYSAVGRISDKEANLILNEVSQREENIFDVEKVTLDIGTNGYTGEDDYDWSEIFFSERDWVGASQMLKPIMDMEVQFGDLVFVNAEEIGRREIQPFGREFEATLPRIDGSTVRLRFSPSTRLAIRPRNYGWSDEQGIYLHSFWGEIIAHELGHSIRTERRGLYCDEYSVGNFRNQDAMWGCLNRLHHCCFIAPNLLGSCRYDPLDEEMGSCEGAPHLDPDTVAAVFTRYAPFVSIMGAMDPRNLGAEIYPYTGRSICGLRSALYGRCAEESDED